MKSYSADWSALLLTFKVTGINVYGVQPANRSPDNINFDSDENKDLTKRKMMP